MLSTKYIIPHSMLPIYEVGAIVIPSLHKIK